MDSAQSSSEGLNDLEVLKKMEDEHLRLQRQVRMIQTDRLHRTMGVHPQFRRQDQLLGTLKKEYINLIKDLKIARSGAHKKKDKKMKLELKRSLLLKVKTEIDADGGLTLMDQLDGLLQMKSKDTLHLRKMVNASKGQLQERRNQSEHRLTSAENQLEAAMLRFNTVQCENRKIREEIEHMLKDRALFNQGWSKMLNALSKGKKFLTDLFESSTLAYDQRDEWCTKLKSIHDKGKMDQILQVQEMRDLQKAYDHETKLHNFLAKKGVIRINKKQEEREEYQMKKEEENIIKQFNKHIKIVDDINEYIQKADINKIIDLFVKREHMNFSSYQLLTDHCAENEVLRRDLRRIVRDIEDRHDYNEMIEVQRQDKIKMLNKQIEEQKSKTEKLRQKRQEQDDLLNGTMVKISEIFRMLDCSLEPFENLLGDKEPSLHQLHLSLRLITDKIKEHTQTVYYYERFIQKKEVHTSRLKKYTVHAEPPANFIPNPISLFVPADPCPSCVEARWLSRVSDSMETPFDSEQAREALRTLAADPAFVRSDRVHALSECRVPRSRLILARRYVQQ